MGRFFKLSKTSESSNATQRQKWYRLYFALIAIDLLIIIASLFLNHKIMSSYYKSLTIHDIWAQRLSRYTDFFHIAAEMDAPGNNVFKTKDPDAEQNKVTESWTKFKLSLKKELEIIKANVAPQERRNLVIIFAEIEHLGSKMYDESLEVFKAYREHQEDKAAIHMASMDQYYSLVNEQFYYLRRCVNELQRQYLERHFDYASSLKKFEVAIGLVLFAMVFGIFLYGRKFSESIKQAETEKKKFEDQLIESERKLREITSLIPGVLYQLYLFRNGMRGFTFVSQGIRELCGFSAASMEQDPEIFFRQIIPAEVRRVEESMKLSAFSLKTWLCEFQITTLDGKSLWLRTQAVPVVQGKDAIILNGMLVDMSEQKAALEKLDARSRQMERMNALMVGRELKMVELKRRITELEKGNRAA